MSNSCEDRNVGATAVVRRLDQQWRNCIDMTQAEVLKHDAIVGFFMLKFSKRYKNANFELIWTAKRFAHSIPPILTAYFNQCCLGMRSAVRSIRFILPLFSLGAANCSKSRRKIFLRKRLKRKVALAPIVTCTLHSESYLNKHFATFPSKSSFHSYIQVCKNFSHFFIRDYHATLIITKVF